jgi:hypothetical protein
LGALDVVIVVECTSTSSDLIAARPWLATRIVHVDVDRDTTLPATGVSASG